MWFVPNEVGLFGKTVQQQENSAFVNLALAWKQYFQDLRMVLISEINLFSLTFTYYL